MRPGMRSRKDHPRSRGVYQPGSPVGGAHCGSSPLARGLPLPGGGVPAGRRIIPARAGFTVGGGAFPLPRGDHPRSRGVYPVQVGDHHDHDGSSPLARGLPTVMISASDRLRIIPARAGFTPTASHGRSHTWDHPRSRGVYPRPSRRGRPRRGSSPLARGLLSSANGGRVKSRIIPARAGFTACPRCRTRP